MGEFFRSLGLLLAYLDTLLLDHDEARVDSFDFFYELFQRDRSCFRLQ